MSGGLLKIKTFIKNIGAKDAADINWSTILDGGLTIIVKKTLGIISNLPAGQEVTVSSNSIRVLGETVITVYAETLGTSSTKEIDAFLFLY